MRDPALSGRADRPRPPPWLPSADAAAGTPTDQLRGADRPASSACSTTAASRLTRPRGKAALRGVAGEIFDFPEITKRALGRHWLSASPGEREELVQLLTALAGEVLHGPHRAVYSGERITWVGESVDGDLATVSLRTS